MKLEDTPQEVQTAIRESCALLSFDVLLDEYITVNSIDPITFTIDHPDDAHFIYNGSITCIPE